ncbi:glycosyltransferase [Microbacteriaceae bacterium 4G12]
MMKQPKILLFTASFGNGHHQVSNVLKHTFEEFGVGTVQIHDLYDEAYPLGNKIAKFLYKQSFAYGSFFYKHFFYFMDKRYGTKATQWYVKLGEKRLETLLQTEQPDIVITTFPVGTVPEWRKKTKAKFQLYTIITDYGLHRTWLHDEIDRYYVATEEVKHKIRCNGIAAEKIHVSGIPIRKEFESSKNYEELIQKYELDPTRKKVLILAGAQGVVKNIKWITNHLLHESNIQVIVVCGRNERLYSQLQDIAITYGDQLKVFGYVEHIHELYEAADIMITKPGGITLSEAIAKKLPTILYKAVPGQEKENSVFFNTKGASVVLSDKQTVVQEALYLLDHDNKLDKMRTALEHLYKRESSQQIISDILESFDQYKAANHTNKQVLNEI